MKVALDEQHRVVREMRSGSDRVGTAAAAAEVEHAVFHAGGQWHCHVGINGRARAVLVKVLSGGPQGGQYGGASGRANR